MKFVLVILIFLSTSVFAEGKSQGSEKFFRDLQIDYCPGIKSSVEPSSLINLCRIMYQDENNENAKTKFLMQEQLSSSMFGVAKDKYSDIPPDLYRYIVIILEQRKKARLSMHPGNYCPLHLGNMLIICDEINRIYK